jgi:hypothetical protein
VTTAQIRAVLPDFLGTFPQLPPSYSAKKVDGVRAYKKARKKRGRRSESRSKSRAGAGTRRPRDRRPMDPTTEGPTTEGPRTRTKGPGPDPPPHRLHAPASTSDPSPRLGQLASAAAATSRPAGRTARDSSADALTLDAIEAAAGHGPALASIPCSGHAGGDPDREGWRRANGNTLAPAHLGRRPAGRTEAESPGLDPPDASCRSRNAGRPGFASPPLSLR